MARSEDGTVTHPRVDEPHDPAPVEHAADPGAWCDFCLVGQARWVLPVKDFDWGGVATLQSKGWWLVCDGCGEGIVRRHWASVVQRSREGAREQVGVAATRSYYTRLYDRVRANTTGPLRAHEAGPGRSAS